MTARSGSTRRLLISLVLAIAGAGCSVSVNRIGDGRFLRRPIEWKKGVTTAVEVAEALGPPDTILAAGDELWFTYRFSDLRTSSFVLSAYGMNFFGRRALDQIDTTLVVSFDRDDKLLTHGTTGSPMDRKLLFLDY